MPWSRATVLATDNRHLRLDFWRNFLGGTWQDDRSFAALRDSLKEQVSGFHAA